MESCLTIHSDLILRREEDGGLLFDPRTGQIHVLSETSAFIVGLLDGQHTRDEIADLLMESFDIPERRDAEQDVDDFLATMRDAQFVGEAV